MFKLINYSIKDTFLNLTRNSNDYIRLCAPYVKDSVIKGIYANKKDNVKLDIVSNFNIYNFYKKSSDLDAFKYIIKNGGNVYNY